MTSDARSQVRRQAPVKLLIYPATSWNAIADRLESLHLSNLPDKEGGRPMSDML